MGIFCHRAKRRNAFTSVVFAHHPIRSWRGIDVASPGLTPIWTGVAYIVSRYIYCPYLWMVWPHGMASLSSSDLFISFRHIGHMSSRFASSKQLKNIDITSLYISDYTSCIAYLCVWITDRGRHVLHFAQWKLFIGPPVRHFPQS